MAPKTKFFIDHSAQNFLQSTKTTFLNCYTFIPESWYGWTPGFENNNYLSLQMKLGFEIITKEKLLCQGGVNPE